MRMISWKLRKCVFLSCLSPRDAFDWVSRKTFTLVSYKVLVKKLHKEFGGGGIKAKVIGFHKLQLAP